MEWFGQKVGPLGVSYQASRFRGRGGVEEYHFMIRPRESGPFEVQLAAVHDAYRRALTDFGLDGDTAVFRRYFCSDPVNQAGVLVRAAAADEPYGAGGRCAVSIIGEPPAGPARVALWAWHIRDPRGQLDKHPDRGGLTLRRGQVVHRWTTGIVCPHYATAAEQTRAVFECYAAELQAHGMSLAGNTLRTWLFLQHIDADYAGMVEARRTLFSACGLTPETHFIASSGIGGMPVDPAVKVSMDAYAACGLMPGQIRYLAAPEHLGPAHRYGATFERATAVAWADRTQVILSGTASIDPAGSILHPGDMPRQLDRTLENVAALLDRAGASPEAMASLIAYVRDPADAEPARRLLEARFPDAPLQVVVAAVCRPGWLIEVEGLATVPVDRCDLPAF